MRHEAHDYPQNQDEQLDDSRFDSGVPVDVRGAIYIPARAYNRYQMWHEYDSDIIERDLSYAARLDLNALRTWLSYEFWLQDSEAHADALEHFLDTADQYGLRILLGLFDGVGREPTYENLLNDNPLTAVQTHSPSTRTMHDEELWETPRQFVQWFMDRYRDDERLLAIELSNEPGWSSTHLKFSKAMADTLTTYRGDRPLTVGSTSLTNNTTYLGWGMDVVQFHYNFPETKRIYRRVLQQANHVAAELGKPVWLSEWQRTHDPETGALGAAGSTQDTLWASDYSSLAPLIRDAGVGNFFWSLMLKPAFTLENRTRGVINGLFHEDGAVWSLDDARAIKSMSGDASFEGVQRREYPEWAEPTDAEAANESSTDESEN
ncbi:glycoside hydrolase family 5 protein [Halegenticoccus tardaugens]|uniref:glycoside hydrolase family 5 protein n=1 Tax=Halegenticoccus tardaugens TaxID=2071624 RepID=UPI001E5EA640|nr:glycoside hydrolase family 5 protein [Halegenticoccus tardaugens]